ncbi:MAG: response regulator transcription factor [Gemmatimonadaceae bacterium]|nr:response regulator transcription factor [Gemmatimonadaceae bacterium]
MRLLFVEDDPTISRTASQYLRGAGFAVDAAETGESALRLSAANNYDAVVLDLRLPGIDGHEVCRRMRRDGSRTRILMATARDSLDDRIAGLDLGADDYLVKPYALAELAARLRALLRRPADALPVRLTVEDLVLDTGTRVAMRGSRPMELTNKEFSVLEYLMRHGGEVITRERIAAHAWDNNYDPTSNVIDVYIGRLRRKIDGPNDPPLLATIRGAGYRLGPPEARSR